MVKNPPGLWETWVRSLGGEDPLEEGMATHSSLLAWRIPWTESLAGCSPRGLKGSGRTERLSFSLCFLMGLVFKINSMLFSTILSSILIVN